jgi:hypothetical protein
MQVIVVSLPHILGAVQLASLVLVSVLPEAEGGIATSNMRNRLQKMPPDEHGASSSTGQS